MEEKLTQTLKSYDYRLKRYDISYSVVMMRCPTDIDIDSISHCIRKTDRIVCLQNHTYAIVFDYTNSETGVQAANNFLESCKCTLSLEPISTTIINASQFESIETMIPTLLTQLHESTECNRMVINGQ